jgi:hypothetical protein
MKDSRLVQDVFSNDQMVIVEKYEDFLNYVYPIVLNLPRKHSVVRDMFLAAAFDQARLFAEAGKSDQVSKLYAADAGLALLRFHLRFMVASSRKLISLNQHKVASVHLAETGRILGAWIKTAKEETVRRRKG